MLLKILVIAANGGVAIYASVRQSLKLQAQALM